MTEITVETPRREAAGSDVKLVGLVSTAHPISHFYQLVLPPIFPLLTGVFGVGYAELGFIPGLMYVASGLMQTPAGILVDRFGPTRVLIGGLGLYAGSVMLFGLVPGFWWLAPLSLAAGLGNCVFHPADYAIMTSRVGAHRLGRAFGAHGVAGNLGWVAAPGSVLALTALFGWRAALIILGAAGLLFAIYLASQHRLLSGEPAERVSDHSAGPASGNPVGVLLSPPILMCFAYFTLLAVGQVGLQTFLPSAVVAAFAVSIEAANLMLTAFLVAGAIGVLGGGLLADRFRHHELVIAGGLAAAALCSLVFAVTVLPVVALAACATLAGLAIGGTMPARDMLVRGAAPLGATGKVFGFVYSGLDLGAAIAPPLLGLLLDQNRPRLVFVVAALALVLAIGSAVIVDHRSPAPARS